MTTISQVRNLPAFVNPQSVTSAQSAIRILHSAFSHRSGITLIGIIAAIVIMGLLGAGVLMIVSVATMGSIQTLNRNQAFFAAESGVSAMKEYMATNGVWPHTNSNVVGQAYFIVKVDTDGQITSVGHREDAKWTSIWKRDEILMALVVYRQNNQNDPRYRTYSNIRRLSNTSTGLSVLNDVQWQKLAANPVTNEFLLGVQDDQRWIWAQTYTNDAWDSNTRLNAAGQTPNENARGFDIAYESLSGRGMAVYSVGSPNPQYRIWTTSGWSAPGSINVGASNNIQWIRLVARPGSDQILCLARWRKDTGNKKYFRNYSSAIIWNGTNWFGLTNLEYDCDSDIDCETMDVAWSSNAALVVYINGPDLTQPKYRTYTAGSWSAEGTNTALDDEPIWIRVEYSPDGAQAYAGFLQSGKQLQGAYWNGSAWGSSNNFGNLEIDTRRCFDIAWSSQTNTLMVVYSLNANAQKYWLSTGESGSLESTDDGQWCVLKPDPFTSDFYYIALDDRNDVNLQRWTGSEWILFPELEPGSANDYLSIDMAFRRDSAVTNGWD